MTTPVLLPVFVNAAGCLVAHPAAYAVLRFAAGPGEARALAELVTQTGALLLDRRWSCLLVDVRQRPCFNREALDWLQQQWFARVVPQPPNLFKALLLPEHTRARAVIAPLLEQAPAFPQHAYFADEQAAHHYLATLAAAWADRPGLA